MKKSILQDLIQSHYPNLDDSIFEILAESTDYIKYPKKTKIISEGKKHHYFYFLIKGSAKSYYLKNDKEVCSWFAFENQVIATMKSFAGEPSNETIELLEDAELIRINTKEFTNIAKTNLHVSQFIIELITEHATFLEERLYQLQFMTSKERYESLINVVPQVLQRLSLTDIASFLGVSRETVSRIRTQK